MILPSKHLGEDRALLTVGAEALALLHHPKTVSNLWHELHRRRELRSPIAYDWFILSLDLLFALELIQMDRGRLSRVAK